ncbi:MAG TPA: hypothetical protein DCM07_10580 [Planctomycetaceae bacterium]|nr:hypothetical protein [Planctomycetaceae bacterium]HBL43389.1 hypothetical protein [Planctomycetaceae bacterium]
MGNPSLQYYPGGCSLRAGGYRSVLTTLTDSACEISEPDKVQYQFRSQIPVGIINAFCFCK